MVDKLKEAMEDENFDLVDDYANPRIILFGKKKTGSTHKDGVITENFQYCIAESWENGEDFSMHHIHSYEGLINWLNKNTKGYDFYREMFENRLAK